MTYSIRPIKASDIPQLKEVLDSIDLFPSEMLEGMMDNYLNNTANSTLWFAGVDENDQALSLGFCAPEQLTEGTFNLYAIGVRKDLQGKGLGRQMMAYLEEVLKAKAARILIVETSSTEDLALTRKFYEQLGYNKEAVIRDFWTTGADKVVYWKSLV